ncbi:cell division FtsA domain-containing protein, partial [Enterococcus faecium]|uniref:cell division FtsA domain-containing protein n=1 Tax=Enterococcus faecium TaxID=1352 RepID=UPI0030C85997
VSSESKEITDEDVRNVASAALVRSTPPERQIVAILPQDFTVDGFEGITDPRGMLCVRMEMFGVVYTGPKTIIHNIHKCVEKAGLGINELVITPLALTETILTDGEKDFGTIVIDMGGGQTMTSVIHDKQLKFTHVNQEGGEFITKDISIVLNTS